MPQVAFFLRACVELQVLIRYKQREVFQLLLTKLDVQVWIISLFKAFVQEILDSDAAEFPIQIDGPHVLMG
jgi:hypothetical protein